MPKLDRSSYKDAKALTEKFISSKNCRSIFLRFFSDSITLANELMAGNWNVNLDPHGHFIRFNVGHVYCIEVFEEYVSILFLKGSLKTHNLDNQADITFKGYRNKKKILTTRLIGTPDLLSTVPDSAACHIKHHGLTDFLPYIEEPNHDFIRYAIKNSTITSQMKRAHSTGFIEYLSSYTRISQPDTNSTTTEDEFYSRQRKVEREAKRLTDSEIRDKAISLKAIPKHIKVVSTKYYRSPFIVEYAKRKANGVCQDCKNPAPFLNKENGEPFLETHHIIPLADGGEDSVENTIALCPNCHRKRHYG